MSFNSIIFIFLFLPLTLLFYYGSKKELRNIILLLASIIFFIWTGINTILIILTISLINFAYSYFMSLCQNETKSSKRKKQALLFVALLTNIGALLFYKYTNFFLETLNLSETSTLKIIVPLGISYITFQQISYIYDIYSNKIKFENKISNYLLYIMFFPKIVAGPISKYSDFLPQLKEREFSNKMFNLGIQKFSLGLGKKVIIASTLQTFVDEAFSLNPENMRTAIILLAMLSYTLQIYFDFSGYTDMALGLGNMFGFHLPENFNRPYIATSVTEFWKRWHISLTSFLREYLYFPLGGSRKSYKRTLLNIFIVFFVSGLWHGAAFTFIVWGIYHGVLMIIEKIGLYKLLSKLPKAISLTYTFIIINISWIFFRSETLEYAIHFIKRVFTIGGSDFVGLSQFTLNNKFFFMLIIALIIVFFPRRIFKNFKYKESIIKPFSIIVLIYSLSIIASGSFKPFIYFNF